jgi:NAD(P)H-hydrate epimerase
VAHVFPPASDAVGELVIADLGVPMELVENSGSRLNLLAAEELAGYLRPRAAASHKGDFGHALIVAGSPGMAGAAAGLVTAAVPEPIVSVVHLGSLESMTVSLPAAGPRGVPADAVALALAACSGKEAAAIGPGLGQEPDTAAAIRELTLAAPLPLVLDADGLNAFAGAAERLRARAAPTLLTPHPGELARLLGGATATIQDDRLAAAREASERTGAIVVLKGNLTLIAEPGGEIWVNPTGNPGMATGGTGDVLTGVLVGLLAQGYEPLAAAQLGVFLHGLAGDLAAETHGQEALRAGDLVESLGAAFRRLREC